MSKLTDFYAHRAAIDEQDPRWEQMEDQLLKEELLPELAEQLKAVLSKVESPLMFSGFYDPNGGLSLSFTKSCIQITSHTHTPSVAQHEKETSPDEEPQKDASETNDGAENTVPKRKKAKSIGFSVSFRDGETIHEPNAVNTWIKALKKIGLENICNNRSKHHAWHSVEGHDVCIVEQTETIRESDGKSPQKLVDGLYVMTQISNEQKVTDLKALADFLPKLGITVIWDNEPGKADPVTPH